MSSKIDIKKIDKNFSSNVSNNLSYRWINPLNSSDISVYGFNWFQKDRRYHRFPQDCDKIIEKLDGCVGILANNSSGGILAFFGSIKSLKIRVKLSYMFNMGHMAYTGQAGFDLIWEKILIVLNFIGLLILTLIIVVMNLLFLIVMKH